MMLVRAFPGGGCPGLSQRQESGMPGQDPVAMPRQGVVASAIARRCAVRTPPQAR
jgi:hypothetical protein